MARPITFTAFGNAQISTAQSKFGGSSLVLDGSGDYISAPYETAIGKWNQATGFTLEYWIRLNSLSGTSYPDGGTHEFPSSYGNHNPTNNVNYWSFGPVDNGNVVFFYYTGGKVTTQTTGITLSTNTWYHLAFVYDGGTNSYKIFVNGVQRASASVSGTPQFNSGIPVVFGAAGQVTQYLNGYIDEVRVSNIPRYTANFTPQTAAFVNDANTELLLHMDGANGSTTITDDTTNPVVPIEGEAALSSSFTQSVSIEKIKGFTVDLTGFIEDDYIADNFFEYKGANAFLIADLTEVIGEIVTGTSNLTAAFTQDATAVKTVDAAVDFESLFSPSITAVASKNGETVMLAQANLSATAARTRDNDVALQTQVNLSLQGDRLRADSAVLSAVTAVTATILRVKQIDSSVAAAFSQTATATRIKQLDADLGSLFTPSITAVASKNGSIDLLASASLTAAPGNIQLLTADLASAFTQTVTTGFVKTDSAALSSQANLIAYAIEYQLRDNPYNRPIDLNSPPYTYSTTRTEGTHSLQADFTEFTENTNSFAIGADENFLIEFSFRPLNTSPYTRPMILEYGSADATNYQNIDSSDSFAIGVNTSFNVLAFTFWDSGAGAARTINGGTWNGTNSWTTVTVKRTGGVITINGADPIVFTGAFNIPTSNTIKFRNGFLSGSPPYTVLYDNFIFLRGSDTRAGATDQTTVAQYTFNEDPTDLWEKTFDGAADLAAQAAQDTQISVFFANNPAALNSQFTQTVEAGRIEATIIDLSAAFTQTAAATRIKSIAANLNTAFAQTVAVNKTASAEISKSATFTQTAAVTRTRADAATLNSQFTQTVTAGKIQQAAADFTAFYSQLTAAAKIGDFFVNAAVVADITTDAVAVKSAEFAHTTETFITVDADRTASGAANLTATFTQTVTGDRFRGDSATLPVVATQTAVAVRTLEDSANLLAEAALAAEVSGGFIGLTPTTLAGVFTQSATGLRIHPGVIELDSTVAQTATAVKSVTAAANIRAEFAQTAAVNKTVQGTADFTAFYTQLSAVVKIGDFLADMNAVTDLSVDAVVFGEGELPLEAEFTQTATATRIKQFSTDLSAQFTGEFSVTIAVDAQSTLDSEFAQSTAAVKVTEVTANLTGAFAPAITVNATRQGDIDLIATVTLTATGDRTRADAADLRAEFAVTAAGGIIKSDTVDLASEFALTASGKLVIVDRVIYTVPRENRAFSIHTENRAYAVPTETRTYSIQEES